MEQSQQLQSADELNNQGLILGNQGKMLEAARCFQQALALNPRHANAYNNLGIVIAHYGDIANARQCFANALAIEPANPRPMTNDALLMLLQGQFEEGWRKYEHRIRLESREPLKNRWDGSPIPGKILAVMYEQGAGDTIQFIRYLPMIRERCGKLIFLCRPEMKSLLAGFPGIDVLTDNSAEVSYHFAIELLSIPGLLKTTSENIPNKVPYLSANAEKSAYWKSRMSSDKLNVGLCWAGNPNNAVDWKRSLHLSDFSSLADIEGVVFHSLQVAHRTEEADSPPKGMHFENSAKEIRDFTDTAAIIDNLDLIITVDTSVAHLAGAMAKLVWTLLPLMPDWRWMLYREDSPWYPTMRLFRQSQADNWQEVILRVANELRQFVRRKMIERFNQGYGLYSQNRMSEAALFFRQALALNPNHIESLLGLGVALEQTGNAKESLAIFESAQSIHPEHTEVYIGLGNAFKALYRLDESAQSYHKAILLKPDHVEAWKGLSTVLKDQGKLEESLLCGRKAISLAPKDIEALLSLGNLQKAMGDVEGSIATYRQALSYDPNHARAHLFLGLALLLAGEFEEGWKEYEWRPKAESGVENHSYPAPRWRGESLNDKRILIHCEQGFGDTFQFIRYLPLLKKMGADVIFECQPELEKFLSQHSEFGRVIPRGKYLPMYEYHSLLMSLPYLFRTDINSIPCDIPYLRAEPAILPHNCPDALKVGIVWAGNPSHKHDKKRSISLSALTQILDLPNVRFYSLQVGARAKDIQESCRFAHITDLSDRLKDFSDTASVIAALDLVISVDTAVAHLSGAMGKPIWVMIPSGPDFRWMRDSEYSPWYPTMRLFRQPEYDRWSPVIERVAQELSAVAGGDTSRVLPQKYQKPISLPILHKADDVLQENIMQEQDDKITALRPCRHGTMLYLKKDIYIGRSLDLYGEFSEGEIAVFSQLIRPGDIVVEAGANIGAHTVFLAKAVGSGGKVFAYEPQRFIHQILCANVALNELTNVHTRQAALGESAGFICIPILDYTTRNNFGGLSLGMGEESVPVETIDNLSLERLRFIKADVEGMEAEVIRGAIQSIRQFRPILYVENDRVQKSEALIALIRSLNYRLWHHYVPLFNPANFAGVQENIFGNIVSKNLICFPKESSVNIQGLEEV